MLLLRNADHILTLDARRRILEHHSLLIDGDSIAAIGPAAEMDGQHLAACRGAGTVIEARGRLVLPGYINTHVHTFEHLSRGLIPDDLSTFDWAVKYARPFYAALTDLDERESRAFRQASDQRFVVRDRGLRTLLVRRQAAVDLVLEVERAVAAADRGFRFLVQEEERAQAPTARPTHMDALSNGKRKSRAPSRPRAL